MTSRGNKMKSEYFNDPLCMMRHTRTRTLHAPLIYEYGSSGTGRFGRTRAQICFEGKCLDPSNCGEAERRPKLSATSASSNSRLSAVGEPKARFHRDSRGKSSLPISDAHLLSVCFYIDRHHRQDLTEPYPLHLSFMTARHRKSRRRNSEQ